MRSWLFIGLVGCAFSMAAGCRDREGHRDGSPPTIADVVVLPADGSANRSETVEVRLEAVDDISLDRVEGWLSGEPMSCDSVEASRFRCVARPDASAGRIEREASIRIVATDSAGNQTTVLRSIRLDLRPPEVAGASVRYRDNGRVPDVFEPTKARAGATIRVAVEFSEPVASSRLELEASNGRDILSFERDDDGEGFVNRADFSARAPSTSSDGVFEPVLTLEDRAGNRVTGATFAEPKIELDFVADALLVAQDQVSFIRSPIGNARAEELIGADGDVAYTVPEGRHYEIGPADGLDPVASMPADTFRLDDGSAPALIRVHDDRGGVLGVLAHLKADADGRWPRTPVAGWADAASVSVSALDDAGNESEPVRIRNSWWVGTTGEAPEGSSGHRVRSFSGSDEGSVRSYGNTIDEREAVEAPDGRLLQQSTDSTWRELGPFSPRPGARWGHVLVYDRARERTVLAGGRGDSMDEAETWEFDGDRWIRIPSTDPTPVQRSHHAGAYDEHRQHVVIFGGLDSEYVDLADTWVWDGVQWEEVTPTGGPSPSARRNHAMAYDADRGEVVLHGGETNERILSDTWVWDGTNWREVSPRETDASPGERVEHAMVYDRANGEVVLFGGGGPFRGSHSRFLKSVWVWDGERWQERSPTGSTPDGRYGHAMAYDEVEDRVILFGGYHLSNDRPAAKEFWPGTWEWDGQAWTPKDPRFRPPFRHHHAMAYAANGRVLSFGGYLDACWVDRGQWGAGSGGTYCNFAEYDDLWSWGDQTQTPAVRFWVDAPPEVDSSRSELVSARVRAFCGASIGTEDRTAVGAELWGWVETGLGEDRWEVFGRNDAGAGETSVDRTRIDVEIDSSTVAQSLLSEMKFECRPNAATRAHSPTVGMDYMEVRLKYRPLER